MVRGTKHHFLFFGYLFLNNNFPNNDNGAWRPHSWMRLVESSNTEVSGASEVPQSRGKLIF